MHTHIHTHIERDIYILAFFFLLPVDQKGKMDHFYFINRMLF